MQTLNSIEIELLSARKPQAEFLIRYLPSHQKFGCILISVAIYAGWRAMEKSFESSQCAPYFWPMPYRRTWRSSWCTTGNLVQAATFSSTWVTKGDCIRLKDQQLLQIVLSCAPKRQIFIWVFIWFHSDEGCRGKTLGANCLAEVVLLQVYLCKFLLHWLVHSMKYWIYYIRSKFWNSLQVSRSYKKRSIETDLRNMP